MEKIKQWWIDFFQNERNEDDWWSRKKQLWENRDGEIVRTQGKGEVFQKVRYDQETHYKYFFHTSFLVKQGEHFHLEESVVPYQFRMVDGEVVEHEEIKKDFSRDEMRILDMDDLRNGNSERFAYDRRAAVQYAERWWNSYNPEFRTFDVDCTNYVSQCLYAGGAPMRGAPVRERGWWYSGDSWSFSWAVAHSLRWYLSGSTEGLKGKEVDSPEDLLPGDIICYDFQGDGRWDHNTIVVSKDGYGMPLVNAHTDNSRHRYWSYEDSTAYTPDIQYKFFRIGE
ncbi:amidase domain-containing protein [Oceanobacillus senegalensis]|uniref:amidase domain-containing protein n=1 Tax=Oceanobacillus senegalensis TaxID=1936063 RepID=UPI000A313B92|nr:amidase domain-containing protein [Oceanobacillus senegalensis]